MSIGREQEILIEDMSKADRKSGILTCIRFDVAMDETMFMARLDGENHLRHNQHWVNVDS
jgi:hypothetical protein